MSPINQFFESVTSRDFSFSQYMKDVEEEFKSPRPPRIPIYTSETRKKTERVALEIVFCVISAVFFPLGLYYFCHWVAGNFVVPAQNDHRDREFRPLFYEALCGNSSPEQTFLLGKSGLTAVPFDPIIKHQTDCPEKSVIIGKRISLLIDGKKISAMIIGTRENLLNRRWGLFSNGNGSTVETVLASRCGTLLDQIHMLGVNFLVYNYPGVGNSQGWTTRDSMIKAHKAMLRFLEDEVQGIGAQEIIQVGISLGGGVQGHAMKTHPMKRGIKYVFMKYLTFSHVSKVPNPIYGLLLKLFGWELNSYTSSKMLENSGKPEIIVQKATALSHLKSSMILEDGIIPKQGSHAYALLNDNAEWVHKKFIGFSGTHWESPQQTKEKAKMLKAVNLALSPTYSGFHPIS